MKKEYQIELNGYSNFFMEPVHQQNMADFTVTFVFVPYTYESCISGIWSNFSVKEKQGAALGVGKSGIVTVLLGVDGQILEMNSLKEHAAFQERNVVTLAFWGTAGWCDLYVNGKLTNRKQFKRHSEIVFPYGESFVGKYVDGETFCRDTRCGVFHGRLDSIAFTDTYRNERQVLQEYRLWIEGERVEINLYAMQDFSGDIYRPVYHLMPPGKWMNEPHAPFFYRGYYHIFYQANPHAPVWDNLCWGHLISTDMVNWQDAGIALYPDMENLDIDGCWSGSACMDFEGMPILFYTAGNNEKLPNQSVAIASPENMEDAELKAWKKEGVVLRQEAGQGFFGEFRDPFVWKKEDKYYALVGTGDAENGGGNALLYTSADLKNFRCHGFVIDYDYCSCKEVGHVWELPVLLPLNDENGEYCCDILLFCACQVENDVVENYYFIGKFDYENMRFEKYHESPKLLDLGYGTFTGPSGFVTPDGRSVLFTIAQGKRAPQEEYDAGWAHNGGMPIALRVKDGALRMEPIREIRRYFPQCVLSEEIKPAEFGTAVLYGENLLENRLLVSTQGNYLELIWEGEDDTYTISYDRKSGEWKAVSEKQGRMISKIRGKEDLVDIGSEDIEIECFVDHSMIEMYLNGRKGMTLRGYPLCKKSRFYVRTDGVGYISIWKYDQKEGQGERG